MTNQRNDAVSRKARRVPYQPVTTEIEEWRKTNPVRVWLDGRPFGEVTRLAKKMGLNRKAIYGWLNGTHLPAADKLLWLCDLCKVGFREYVAWWNNHPSRRDTTRP